MFIKKWLYNTTKRISKRFWMRNKIQIHKFTINLQVLEPKITNKRLNYLKLKNDFYNFFLMLFYINLTFKNYNLLMKLLTILVYFSFFVGLTYQ